MLPAQATKGGEHAAIKTGRFDESSTPHFYFYRRSLDYAMRVGYPCLPHLGRLVGSSLELLQKMRVLIGHGSPVIVLRTRKSTHKSQASNDKT